MWTSERIYLRHVDSSDLQTLLQWENNPENWNVSETTTPYSKEDIANFIIEQADFKNSSQIRYMICLKATNESIGAIDLFNIDKLQKKAGVGILIDLQRNRKKGYAFESVETLKRIAKNELQLQQLYCTIHIGNIASKKLFEKSGFQLKHTDTITGIDNYSCSLLSTNPPIQQ